MLYFQFFSEYIILSNRFNKLVTNDIFHVMAVEDLIGPEVPHNDESIPDDISTDDEEEEKLVDAKIQKLILQVKKIIVL